MYYNQIINREHESVQSNRSKDMKKAKVQAEVNQDQVVSDPEEAIVAEYEKTPRRSRASHEQRANAIYHEIWHNERELRGLKMPRSVKGDGWTLVLISGPSDHVIPELLGY